MSTRSMIMLEIEPNVYKGIYCQHDGYLTYNGAMLIDHYSNREKVEKLISLGDISQLDKFIEPNPNYPHSFDNRQEDVTVFYGRDRGENKTEAKIIDLKEIDEPQSWIEYCYIFTLKNKWKYFECGQLKKGLKSLQNGLNKEYESLGFQRPYQYYGFYTEDDIKRYRRGA